MVTFLNLFLRDLQNNGCTHDTLSYYRRHLLRVIPKIGNKSLPYISEVSLHKALTILITTMPQSYCQSTTRNLLKSVCRSFFSWAVQKDFITNNPAAGMKNYRTFPRHTVPITIAELTRFMRAIRNSADPLSARDQALFATYAFTGVRRSEALGMRIQDYDCSKKVIYVLCKGVRQLTKPVPASLEAIYSIYLKSLDMEYEKNKEYPFFPGRLYHNMLTPRQAHNRFNKWKKISGLREELTIHSFRAGFATSLYQTTHDLLLVSQALGHTDIRSTCRYIIDNYALGEVVEEAFKGWQ